MHTLQIPAFRAAISQGVVANEIPQALKAGDMRNTLQLDS